MYSSVNIENNIMANVALAALLGTYITLEEGSERYS